MARKCPNCSFKITARNQLCDDYRDPAKAYGCPGCGTFYLLPKHAEKPCYYWAWILGNGLVIGFIWSLVQVQGVTRWLFWGYIMALGLVWLVTKLVLPKVELQASGHRAEIADD